MALLPAVMRAMRPFRWRHGRLYNWHAVNDARGLCPSGWHVPSDGEWTTLTDGIGGALTAGNTLKAGSGGSTTAMGRLPMGSTLILEAKG